MFLKRYIAAAMLLTMLLPPFLLSGADVDFSQDFHPVQTGRYWVFLEPEEYSPDELQHALEETARSLTPRSLARRSKVIHHDPPVRICDLPVSRERIEAIETNGCRVIRQVRYLNAVIVSGPDYELNRLADLGFVRNVTPVLAYPMIEHEPGDATLIHRPPKLDDEDDYGWALGQSRLVNLVQTHDLGYRGNGVLMGVQDTGFSLLGHRCFRYLEVIAAYDFLNDDDDVSDHGDTGSGSHGIRTLSVIAALDSGNFIGAAPGAQFVLTKTEDTTREEEFEEDLWIAGLWFHDSLGVEVLSSSLSYRNWYDWEEMDGRTAVTSIAADSAIAAGMIIVNSVGNTGNRPYPDSKIGAPADSRYVISAGGVVSDGEYWHSASRGPTYDRRIKPDVSAQAYSVYTCSNFTDSTYRTSSGTSFSCPMIAGIAALLLEANPELTPQQVMNILHETASHADSPDTLTGYGIVNAYAAVRMAERLAGITSSLLIPVENELTVYPNPFNGSLNIDFRRGYSPSFIGLYDLEGRRLFQVELPTQNHGSFRTLDLSSLNSGSYILTARGRDASHQRLITLIK